MSAALVLLSGGQDSTTCLYWAKTKFESVRAVGFYYEQRHAEAELDACRKVAAKAQAPVEILDLSFLARLSDSALVNRSAALTPGSPSELPSSFVPGRNLIFLSVATALASKYGISDLVTGVCQTDYSGYPDCRQDFIWAMERAASHALDSRPPIQIHTPLMHMTKAQTVKLARELPGCWEALALSVTCYNGTRCGTCPSCLLRAKGFHEAGEDDPACTP